MARSFIVHRGPDGTYVRLSDRVVRAAPPPTWLKPVADEVRDVSGLSIRPTVAWVEHVNGALALAYPDIVVLGARDLSILAEHVWAELNPTVPGVDASRWVVAAPEFEVLSFPEVWRRCAQLLLAHELGHLARFERGDLRGGLEYEAEADGVAGMIAEALGWNASVDVRIMATIGCNLASCSHPTSKRRAAQYLAGRRAVRAARELDPLLAMLG
jgi:hypothetical protein